MPTAKLSNPQKPSLMNKQLVISMEKDHDFADGEAARYNILAHFKEMEAEKNRILNAAVEKATGTPEKASEAPMTLSQQVALGILRPAPANVTNTTNDNRQSFTKEVTQTVRNIRVEGARVAQEHGFTVTDLLLSIIAFFLFILLLIHD